MSKNNYFQFKKFIIYQDKSAMKVNTDGVLLGAWVHLEGAKTALDIGTGRGLISLMISQRSGATVTGVEIEKNAAEEAIQNVARSEWKDRISIRHISFQDFTASTHQKFDVIVSNPPFFSNSVKNVNPHLSIARHNHLLPFEDIISGTKKLLGENGKLSLVLPFGQAGDFIEMAGNKKLFLTRLTEVKPFPDKTPNRCLMEFSQFETGFSKNQISIYNHSRKEFSEQFVNLARDFYLKL